MNTKAGLWLTVSTVALVAGGAALHLAADRDGSWSPVSGAHADGPEGGEGGDGGEGAEGGEGGVSTYSLESTDPNAFDYDGAPQIAASKSWDVGYTGSVPAVLGAVRFGLHTIAFSDDQSATNGLYVNGPNADAIIKNPASLKGGTVFLTGNSTVDLAARSCLQKFGLGKGDVTVRSLGQAEIIAAMSSGSASVGGLWARGSGPGSGSRGPRGSHSRRRDRPRRPGIRRRRAGRRSERWGVGARGAEGPAVAEPSGRRWRSRVRPTRPAP